VVSGPPAPQKPRRRRERVERRFAAPLELPGHVFLDHVHRHVARAFVHHLHAFGPRAAGEFALHLEFAELLGGRPQGLVGVGNQAGAQAIALMEFIFSVRWRWPLGKDSPPFRCRTILRAVGGNRLDRFARKKASERLWTRAIVP